MCAKAVPSLSMRNYAKRVLPEKSLEGYVWKIG